MQTITEMALQKAVRGVFTRMEAACWIGSSGARLDALLKRAVASTEVWRFHRGLYCLSNRYTRQRINPFEVAQLIHGPSYISLESALSYHGWIPEAVHAITNTSMERSRTFNTPLGMFSYARVPQRQLFTGVRRISGEDAGSFFIAEPLKALADYVYVHRCDWSTAAPIVESLRVDEELLSGLSGETFDEIIPHFYGSGRVRRFLTGLRKDLKR